MKPLTYWYLDMILGMFYFDFYSYVFLSLSLSYYLFLEFRLAGGF